MLLRAIFSKLLVLLLSLLSHLHLLLNHLLLCLKSGCLFGTFLPIFFLLLLHQFELLVVILLLFLGLILNHSLRLLQLLGFLVSQFFRFSLLSLSYQLTSLQGKGHRNLVVTNKGRNCFPHVEHFAHFSQKRHVVIQNPILHVVEPGDYR